MQTDLDIYTLVAPLQRKYGEDVVQDALTHILEFSPEVYQKPPVEFVKFATKVCRGKRRDEVEKSVNRTEVQEATHRRAVYAPSAEEAYTGKVLAQDYLKIEGKHCSQIRKYQLLDRLFLKYAS